jgi:hypothetical protein
MRNVENHTFIDRFFHSQFELVELNNVQERDANTLYTFLNNLHTTGDRLKEGFSCDIKSYPEFKILRLIRNYFHHVGDVKEIRLLVLVGENVLVSHNEHLLIPLEVFAKSVKSFIDNNTFPEHHKLYKKKKAFIDKEMDSISEMWDYTKDLLANLDAFSNKPILKLDGVDYELGFDMYKFVYNITNIIADKCRGIDELKIKNVIIDLDKNYTTKYNIEKRDMWCLPDCVPVTTTKGFVFPKTIELSEGATKMDKFDPTHLPIVDQKTGNVVEIDATKMNNSELAYSAFMQFKDAYKKKRIDVEKGRIHKDSIIVFADSPAGHCRLTYGLINRKSKKNIIASVAFAQTDSYNGLHCFDVSYCTEVKFRGKGYATQVIRKSIDEMKKGFTNTGLNEVYLEMKVDRTNIASTRVAKKFANTPVSENSKSVLVYYVLVKID